MKIDPSNLKEFVKRFAVAPGSKIDLKKDFDPGDTAGYEKPENASAFLDEGVEFLADYQERLYAENSRALLVVLQALRCGRQGQHDRARHERGQSDGLPGHQLQGAIGRGAGSRLSLARRPGAAGARQHRHLQPVALRGSAGGARPSAVPEAANGCRRAPWARGFGSSGSPRSTTSKSTWWTTAPTSSRST